MEERWLWVFESKVLRRIFWTGRDEVTGEWRRLLNGEIYELYCSPNEENEMGKAFGTYRYRKYAYKIVTRKREGDHVDVLGLVGMILNCIFRKWNGKINCGLI
jgi:hypothetical protein